MLPARPRPSPPACSSPHSTSPIATPAGEGMGFAAEGSLTSRIASATIASMSTESVTVERRAAVHAALGDPARLAVVDELLLGDRSPGELAAALGLASNLLAHHLHVLEAAGVIGRTRSEADRRRTYVRLIPAALAVLAPAVRLDAPRVVFVCTHNSA